MNGSSISKQSHELHLCADGWRLYDVMCAVPDDRSNLPEWRALNEHRSACQECTKVTMTYEP